MSKRWLTTWAYKTPNESLFLFLVQTNNQILHNDYSFILLSLIGVSPENPPENWIPATIFDYDETTENKILHS